MSRVDTYIRKTHDFEDPFFIFMGDEAEDAKAHHIYIGRSGVGERKIDESCAFQLEYLKAQGLTRKHTLMDLGCGSLRAGIAFIPFLNKGNYLGIDISEETLKRGIRDELGFDIADKKKPEFVISDDYEYELFSKKPDFIIANSVFTHLKTEDTARCFERTKVYLGKAPFQFFATFTQALTQSRQPDINHYYGGTGPCSYTAEEFAALGEAQGWKSDFIGHWGHFRNDAPSPRFKFQMMMRFYQT